LLPETFASKGWSTLIANPRPLVTSFALALSTAAAAIAASIAWLESQPEKRDAVILAACGAALCIPALMIALGQYRLFLQLGITGTALAMFLAHVLPVTAYIFVMLQAPYRAYNPRWQAAAQGLLSSRMSFLVKIKWPMLKAPILAAAAVGFAVSIAQYVPAQLASAGRFTTLPMEAVTLSSGGNRALIATYAVALTALPLAAFLLASFFGRPRWSAT
jgi:putative thiamine transport system permease protein